MSYLRDPTPAPGAPGRVAASALYRRFHGTRPLRLARGLLPRTPPVLVALGELRGVIYRAAREPGAGKGAGGARTFVHFMERPPLLACDPEGRQLYVIGGRYRVTRRGIEG